MPELLPLPLKEFCPLELKVAERVLLPHTEAVCVAVKDREGLAVTELEKVPLSLLVLTSVLLEVDAGLPITDPLGLSEEKMLALLDKESKEELDSVCDKLTVPVTD